MLKLRNVVTFLCIAGAAIVAFDSDSITRMIWEIRYGHRQTWEGLDIRLASNEYFMPISYKGDTLFIRDNDSVALIFLRLRNFTPDEMRSYANKDCKILECSKVDEQKTNVGQVEVLSLSYLVGPPSEPILQHQRLVEGSGIWVQYTGPLNRYQNSKGTLDRITEMLVKKVEKREALSARR
jgi:hypothetical protein